MLRVLFVSPLLLSLVGCAELDGLNDDRRREGESDGDEGTSWSEPESEMLRLVNAFRAAGGDCPGGSFSSLPPLTGDDALAAAARGHSQDMADNDYFDHEGLDGSSFADRIFDAGYDAQPYGENIAAGNTDPVATLEQWHNSDGHCRNMTTTNANEIGVGFASGGSFGAYWTQNFGVR